MNEILKYFKEDELAEKSWTSKYALRDKNDVMMEKTPDDMHKRLAKQFARMEKKQMQYLLANNSKEEYLNKLSLLSDMGKATLAMSEEEIYQLFKDFKQVIPAGSVMSMLGNPYQIGSLSNCFVIGQPEDSYSGIMKKRAEQAQLMKRRGGVGKDLSLLRPKGAFVNNAAKTSTGPVSFMDVDSEITREVAQDGRRGALMLTIDITHPDSDKFIVSKQDTSKITGANISVKLTDEFMNAVDLDVNYLHKFPVDFNIMLDSSLYELNKLTPINPTNKIWVKKIKAKELWDSLIHCAWNTAEPGIMFSDRHHNYSPDGVYEEFKGVTTNPCGEIFMQPYDSCRLIHINLTSFVINPFTENAYFDMTRLYEVAYKTMKLGDDLIDLEIEHIERIIQHISHSEGNNIEELDMWVKIQETAKRGRRAGVGFTGLADVFAMLGFQYGSIESLEYTKLIMHIKMEAELDSTIDMAITRGSFEACDMDKEFELKDLADINGRRTLVKGNNAFYEFLLKEYPEQTYRMIENGRRNVSWNTVAPTGTVSIMAQVASGIEPIFLPYYERSKKCNSDTDRVDFIDATGEKFTKFYVLHPMFKIWLVKHAKLENIESLDSNQLTELYKVSPWYGSDSASISWKERVELQAIVQNYTTHSISSTINLPKETTKELVSEIFMKAWKSGLKGITVYRDGCRDGILNAIPTAAEQLNVLMIKENSAPKRPRVLPAELHVVKSRGVTYAVILGFLNERPYEIFAYELKTSLGISFTKATVGTITKVKKGQYRFDSEHYSYLDLQLANDKIEEKACTIYTSMLLRHGAGIPFIIETTRKINNTITSFASAMCRVLDKYTLKEIVKGEKCEECGGEMIREAGCTKCLDCGTSHCLFIYQWKK